MTTSLATRRTHDGESGFSLIELVIAMVILGSMSIAIIGLILNAQGLNITNRNRVAASNLAARELDLVREQFSASDQGPIDIANAGLVTNPHPLAGGTAGQPLVIDGTKYTIVRSAQWNVAGTGASACDGGSLVAYPTLGVTVSVTWPNMKAVKPVTTTAALTPSKTTGVSTIDSFIASKVIDQDGAPLTGMSVTATSPSGVVTSAATDDTGCAVIKVSPPLAGEAYTVRVADSGYVDISGTPNPTKSTGTLTRGSIFSGAGFAVGKAGTLTVKLVRADGVPLTSAQVAGSKLTLVASEYSGASGQTTRTVTGVTTTFASLWPTTYGAFFGTVPPTGGYLVTDLAPGASVIAEVEFEMATVIIDTPPAGTTRIVAMPSGQATTCAAGSGTSAAVSGGTATFVLLPGSYDFYAVSPSMACSAGPAAQALGSGENDAIGWGTTTLRLQNVPTTGLASGAKIWAVDQALAGTLTTCPATVPAYAVDITGAATAPVALAAGNWYVWLAGTTVPCLSFPTSINATALTYGQATTRTWDVVLVATGVPANSKLLVAIGSFSGCNATGTILSAATSAAANATLSVSVPRPSSGNTNYNTVVKNMGTNTCSTSTKYVVANTTGLLSKLYSTGTVGP
ncbi:prepilin-type N-terminal cleavage/methylation domain-containing protein [Cellulomonas sp.]|uniref:prepilin-type N-terminal cleavage/methylation domain-containing protein n=1 Tax=Cellulomonas sp. TaxID=40001 RepID=UPI003BAA9415